MSFTAMPTVHCLNVQFTATPPAVSPRVSGGHFVSSPGAISFQMTRRKKFLNGCNRLSAAQIRNETKCKKTATQKSGSAADHTHKRPRREGPVISEQRERPWRQLTFRWQGAPFVPGVSPRPFGEAVGGYPEITQRIRTVRSGGSNCKHSRHHWLFAGLPRRIRPSTDLRDFTGRILATGRLPDTRVSYGGGQPQVSRLLPWSVRSARGLEGSESAGRDGCEDGWVSTTFAPDERL